MSPATRLVRVAVEPTLLGWRFNINGKREVAHLSASNFTNEVAALHLHQGDIVLIQSLAGIDSTDVQKANGWLSEYCDSNRVAIYVYPTQELGTNIFSITAFHWSAPYNNPFDLKGSSFFYGARRLGVGHAGFERMLHLIAREHPPEILILGSLFDRQRYMDVSWPYDPSPYYFIRMRLNDVLKTSGTDLVSLSVLPE